jgi:hypothetical protein
MVRTALFNWAYAHHTGGTFVFRIEDTDSARDSEDSYRALLDALRWLGLTWDEGPEVGGPYGPYRQSSPTAATARQRSSRSVASRPRPPVERPVTTDPAETYQRLRPRRSQPKAGSR